MGFLKFLKRDKKREDFSDLDLPPAPPPLEGFDDKTDFDFGELSKDTGKELPMSFDFGDVQVQKESGNLPDFPEFPEIDEKEPAPIAPVTSSVPAQPVPELSAAEPKEEAAEEYHAPYRHHAKAAVQEKRIFRMPERKELYVRADKFKASLDNISTIRADLRKSEEALMRLENLKNSKDRSFDKFKSSLDDIQKKLIFVDRILFKGDKNESF